MARTARKQDIFDMEPEEQFGEDFKQEQVIVQLRKVVDSEGNPNPIHWIETDSGKIWIGFKNARRLISLFDRLTNRSARDGGFVSNQMRPEFIASQTRAKVLLTEKMQTVSGLKQLVEFVKQNYLVS